MSDTIHITGDGNAVGDFNNITVRKTATSTTSGVTLSEFTDLLAQLRAELQNTDLDSRTARIVSADLDVVEGEVGEAEPDGATISQRLEGIAKALTGATAIGTAGTGLLDKVIEIGHKLFG